MKKAILITGIFLLTAFMSFAQTSITCDTVFQTSTCAGGNVIVPFQYTGSFPFGNTFTAQLSDWLGQFGTPVNIGSTNLYFGGSGVIFAAIPASANFSLFYRVRIISSNPMDTSSTSPNTVIVTQIAQLNQIVSNPGDSACPGDTINLFAVNFANSYAWSTGDTSNNINVTQSGIYSVTTTDALGCQSTAYDTIVFDLALCTGIAEENLSAALQLRPNPTVDWVTIQFEASYGDDTRLILTDALGRIVFETQLQLQNGQQQLNVSGLPSGIYFLRISDGNSFAVKKLIKE
jgi:Secretion system C-terminal sorting domain